jgi:excisionase family DNA binding protein
VARTVDRNQNSLLTAEEIGEHLGLRQSTVSAWGRSGKIPAIRLSSRTVRYQLTAVLEALAVEKSDKAH